MAEKMIEIGENNRIKKQVNSARRGKRDVTLKNLAVSSKRTAERGFASMDPERQREIASKGGRAAHEKGTAHEFSTEEARAAGRKGGEKISQNREHMSEIGSRGGKATHSKDETTPA